jgi:hypothetical protein
MALLEGILTTIGVASGAKDLRDFIKEKLDERVQPEEVLADLVEEAFREQRPRLEHLCPDGDPMFHKEAFIEALRDHEFIINTSDDLLQPILPIFKENISTPGATCGEESFLPVYESVLNYAINGMWRRISEYGTAVNRVLLEQGETIIIEQRTQANYTEQHLKHVKTVVDGVDLNLQKVLELLDQLVTFAQGASRQTYDQLFDSAPPPRHRIAERDYINPFTLARAEDFNHNYTLLARLFQSSPEWDSIQQREVNVFIEGGRGTGKSMLLRRLTAQATVAHKRIKHPYATFDEVNEEYFGVYIKLTRGYYDQFSSIKTVTPDIRSLLAQHELNVEIFDAFVDALRWLVKEGAVPALAEHTISLARDLTSLFNRAPAAQNLEELHEVIRFEQDQITTYLREKAFGRDLTYQGSARDAVGFMRQLSEVFRNRLFPRRTMRLFLLIDEFESLTEVQQIALNTVMKMRLPDLSLKIAVRKSGRKTADTFTPGDPIQQPRDYTEVRLDYDVTKPAYKKLLQGIAAKRLEDAKYPKTAIESYLPKQDLYAEVPPEKINEELRQLWQSGTRRNEEINQEFIQKYTPVAVYRALAKSHKRKTYSGFEQYVLLSSGIISNFIELCKYTFYFALSQRMPLQDTPQIPPYLQSEATYSVSQRLFSTIDGNVPVVGSILVRMLTDIGAILRSRLLSHSSEPEANRLQVVDYGNLSDEGNKLLANVIDEAIVWSMLHIEEPGESFRPKNAARPPSAELIINRIYCPALGISPRARWRVKVQVSDLRGLIDPSTRTVTYRSLMRTIGADKKYDRVESKQPNFFAEAAE